MSDLLGREEIVELLTQLGARLHARGVSAELYIVGGTAMVLAYDRLRLTRDVDAVSVDQTVVEDEARRMAQERRDLAPDWLNGRVRPRLPQVLDGDSIEALSMPGLSVTVASPRHLLAMKVRAARGERDLADIEILAKVLALTSVRQVLDVADEVWGPGMLRDEVVFAVTEGLKNRGFAT